MNNELYHHGVKGMKWGVRNNPERKGVAYRSAIGIVGKKVIKDKPLVEIDVSKAKNSTTKRVANDYYKLSEREFRGKHHVNKKKFAKRYIKTDGDTYTLGRKKQALAIAFLGRMQGKSLSRSAVDIMAYDAASKAEQKAIDKGRKYTAGAIKQMTRHSLRTNFSNTYYMPNSARRKYYL